MPSPLPASYFVLHLPSQFKNKKVSTFHSPLLRVIKDKAAQLLPEIIGFRRHLHQHPELSFFEEKTAQYITHILDQYEIAYTTGWAGHGVVATLQGQSDEVVALRADMDALPITEANDVTYKSQKDGVMHACGHDVHTASLLGAAIILKSIQDELPYTVRFVFQPGEEKLPGGASIMIQEGVLSDPIPTNITGQHVFPSMEVGKVGIRSGLYMASADEIYITITGKGGHAAMPQDVKDVVLAASQVIVSLQQIVARNAPPTIPTVLSFGKFNTLGGATNVIPDQVAIDGTFRTMDEKWRAEAHQMIINIIQSICLAYGVGADVNIVKGYPCLINDDHHTAQVKERMISYLGAENVVDLDLRMTSEDFAFYSQILPSCFYRLGTGNKAKGITSPVHTSTFDIDEQALEIGMGLMAWIAVSDSK
jgi:amidohydrolase